jgi:predicted ABC-type ATPase
MIEKIIDIIGGEAPVFFMIAGPNGAGKSTYRKKRLDPIGLTCIDPDEVAMAMFERHPHTLDEALKATQEATARVMQHFSYGHSVCLETVFSDNKGHKLELIREAKNYGFKTCLIFIGLESSQLCIARVMDRVDNGGHDVPDEMIEDRYPKCFGNLKKAVPLVDVVLLVDNSGMERHYEFGYAESGQLKYLAEIRPEWFSAVASVFN